MPPEEKHPDPLAAMLDTGSPLRLWLDEELEAIFRHQLDAPLAVDLGDLATAAGQSTFRELLNHAKPPVQFLLRVKDFAKQARTSADTPLPPEIATILYFAAIAAARLRLGQRISELDDATLAQSLTWCAARPWIDQTTRRMFGQVLANLGAG